MWTETTRELYRREGLHYASDMTDAEWALIKPFMPAEKRLGRPRVVPFAQRCLSCDRVAWTSPRAELARRFATHSSASGNSRLSENSPAGKSNQREAI
jgi:hypothetical protein